MTVTLKQINQVQVTVGENVPAPPLGLVVLDPSVPALVFNIGTSSSSSSNPIINVALVIGSSKQYIITSSSGLNQATIIPPLFFSNYVLTGGFIINNSSCSSSSGTASGTNEVGYYLSYNKQTQTADNSCTVEPDGIPFGGFFNVVIDFQHSMAYIFRYGANPIALIIFSMSLNAFTSFLSSLSLPSGYQVAYIEPPQSPAPPSQFVSNYSFSTVVLYNGTFYIGLAYPQITSNGSVTYPGYSFIWSVSVSSISFSSSIPSSPSQVGNLTQITSNTQASTPYIYLNYYVNNGSITTELLIGQYVNGNVVVYSYNFSSLSTLIQLSVNASYYGNMINIGGVLAFVLGNYSISGSTTTYTYWVGIYDRKTNSYETTSQFTNITSMDVAPPYYAVTFSGSAGNITATIYQIIVDVLPAIQNLTAQNNTISGTVVNLNNGQPISGVTVYLYSLATLEDDSSSGSLITSTTTDANGNFSFSITQSGYYAVKVIY